MGQEGAPKNKKEGKKESAPNAEQLANILEALKTKAARERVLRKYGIIKQPDDKSSGGKEN